MYDDDTNFDDFDNADYAEFYEEFSTLDFDSYEDSDDDE